ncbi:GGDEF domain-containing response regulator [Nitrosovibrio tenuis]|uniref:Response regulator receiver modulated diguanylate cyclase n=1 Tax=Nitrosovibrio tenuis TaxID=1233 RepID=A0A1H7MJS4_9PROT|nr:diguanylate cyclase [Nitrosovibrio tenuis]SEL10857.1 response regulator receiver modulated diguanylate cyclase [Nitrosovibrio tenuis]
MISETEIHAAKILIVDDQEVNIQLLEHMLTAAKYTSIASTTDPYKVSELHRQHHYDLILLDLKMAGMDGFQVLEALKQIETDGYLSVLVVTANPDCKLRALQSGAKDFISKPFDMAEVLARVHNLLEVRLLHQQARNYAKAQEFRALHDPLTGLANRRLLLERVSQAIIHARRNTGIMAVVYLDLDGFREINNTLGHGAGDSLLKMVAARLIAAVRQEDTVARLGGDEFVIAMPHVNSIGGVALATDKVIKALSQPYKIQSSDVNVTASAGVGLYPIHGKDVKTLLKNADAALLEAKNANKNTYRISMRANA